MVKSHQSYFSKLYMALDIIILVISFAASYFVRFDVIGAADGVKYLPLNYYLKYLIYVIIGFTAVFLISGLYNSKKNFKPGNVILCTVRANFFGAAYFLALLYIFREVNISRAFIFVFACVSTCVMLIYRLLVRLALKKSRKMGKHLKNVLIIGYSYTTERYIEALSRHPEWGYKVCGILCDNMAKNTRYMGVSVKGAVSDLKEVLDNNSFTEIVICLKVTDYNDLKEIVTETEKHGIHIKFAPDFQNMISSGAEIEDMDGLPVINIRKSPLSYPGNRFVKRTGDIILSLILIIIFFIPMLIICIIIRAGGEKSVIFKQTRVGKNGKNFTMYKFRTMRDTEPEEEKHMWTTENDSRVTASGAFFRRTSLDELPQLFNILRGDMSLVGPRPERPYFVDKFKEEIPRYMVKHQVRPGLTGLAQVTGYRGDTNIARRIEQDINYIENWSVPLDISILVRTIFCVHDKNAY